MKTLKHFINGQYVAGRSEDTFELVSPVDGETYALSPNANAEEVEQAYSAAEAAFSIWRKSTPAQRQKALLQLADEIERNVERLVNAQSQETGQLRHFIEKEEIAASCDAIRFFAGAARCLEGKAAGEYSAGFTSTIRREAAGYRWTSHAMELPVHDGGMEDCASAGGRQYGRIKTQRHYAGQHAAVG